MEVSPLSAAFGGLTIAYDERVLEPRPWTAHQSRWAAELAASAPGGQMLELCSGAGHIGLLAMTGTTRSLVMVDVDAVACGYARRNAEAADLADRLEVRHGPMTQVLSPMERFALVLADPPWVRSDDVGRFPEDPLLAIDGGPDGLDLARSCVEVAAAHLEPRGHLLLQLGSATQAAQVGDAGGALALVEVRQFEGGIVARFDRR